MVTKRKMHNDTVSPFKRDQLRNQKQDFICQVASALFNKNGFEATSLDEVAKQIAISKPSIYYYYNNKSELLLGCYNRTLDICENLFNEAKDISGTGLDKLCLFVEKLIIIHCASGNVAVVNDVDALPADSIEAVRARSKQLTKNLESLFELGMSEGSIRPLNAPVMTRFMMGGVNWMPKWYGDQGAATPEEIAQIYVAFLRGGIGPGPGSNVNCTTD